MLKEGLHPADAGCSHRRAENARAKRVLAPTRQERTCAALPPSAERGAIGHHSPIGVSAAHSSAVYGVMRPEDALSYRTTPSVPAQKLFAPVRSGSTGTAVTGNGS